LRAYVPELQQRGGLWRPLLAIAGVFLLTTLYYLAADRYFPEWMPDGEIVVLALGLLILSRFYSQRRVYQRKYGELAYQTAYARFCIPGLGIILASIAHLAYISGPDLPQVWWKPLFIVLGVLLCLIGLALGLRSVTVLGVDRLAMLYVYYPAEDRRVTAFIYGLMRHPIYSATLAIGLGLALIHANWYALLVALLLPIFFLGWVRLAEEPELLERFPEYAEYRRRVPAFTPRAAELWSFTRWLVTGKVRAASSSA
jgi:protein-S-isoprenylcysteine O-methyltransferase Ste14